MALEDSAKLIKEISDRHEADDYIKGLLKDPAMQADMERVAEPVTWAQAAEGLDPIQQHEAPASGQELER